MAILGNYFNFNINVIVCTSSIWIFVYAQIECLYIFHQIEHLYSVELSVCISLRAAPSRFRSHNGQVRAVSGKKGLVTKTINHSRSPTTVVTNTAVEQVHVYKYRNAVVNTEKYKYKCS